MEVALEEEVTLVDVIGRRDGAWSTALWTAWDTAEAIDLWYIVRHVCEFPVSETEIVMWLVTWNWHLLCIKLNHNLLVKSWTHDLKSGFIISKHEHLIWNQDSLYQIMNAWFEIRIYYIKSWMHDLILSLSLSRSWGREGEDPGIEVGTHDLKSGFIISNHKLIIWNRD